MIILPIPNDKPQDEIGQAVAQNVEVKTIPEQPLLDYCLCQLGVKRCDYTELAFYDGSNDSENDYTSLFVNKVDATDEIVFTLINQIDNTETILNAGNEGDYGTYSEDDDHIGVNIDYTTLKASIPDLSKIFYKVEHTVFNEKTTIETHLFSLIKWNAVRANGTVRIETINSGRIESGADYGDLGWRKSIRIKGFFGHMQPDKNKDNYMDGTRTIQQIQDKVIPKYILATELLPQNILNMISFNDMLANEIFISDYNLKNANYKGISVDHESTSANYYDKNPNGSYEMEFVDRTQNIVKRNV